MRLSQGVEVTLTYGQYRAILATNRNQADRAVAYQEFHKIYEASINTYASLYDAVLQRDLFFSQARGYASTLDAALHGNNIPTAVVENLIAATKAGTDPLRRYHRLRKQALGLDTYHSYDTTIPLVDFDRKYPYEDVLEWLPASVAPLGPDYERELRTILDGQCIDVYENPGKRSGAYSAPVYGVQPYMLLNYNDTLDAVFTLAHEMGHSMHTVLSHAHQPFVYAGYTIFVAEVPSTLSEALFLNYMLAHTSDERERIVLLQHAIDGIVSTFYTQVMFADFELQAHRLAERGQPVTGEVLARHVLRSAEVVSRRRAGLRRSIALHVGTDPALLQHAVLRLPVRHVLCVERADHEAAGRWVAGVPCRRGRSLSRLAEVGRQRSSDGAAPAGRRRSEPARAGPRRGGSTRRARHTTRRGGRMKS